MKANHSCRWVCHRLPLLAGGELEVRERRKVERHLIICPGCRSRRDASADALAALRLVGEASPSAVDAPSLWPSLARQIRQSRHASPAPSPWASFLPRPWTFATLATGLGAVLAASIARPPADREDPAPAPAVVIRAPAVDPSTGPTASTLTPAPDPVPAPEPPSVALPSRRGALPEAPVLRPGELARAPIKPIEPPSSALRFDYDLDHGTPMTPGAHDPQRTY